MFETGQLDRDSKVSASDETGLGLQHESAARIVSGVAGASPIDFVYLRRYTCGDANLEREVLELFCSHAPSLIAALKSASSEKAWRDAAHSLKGSALALGAREVAREAERAEAASTRYDQATDIIPGLERAIDEVRRFVAALHLTSERPHQAAAQAT